MNNSLADLKDIHVPANLGWWPPAYGWWLLILISLALIGWLCIFMFKRNQQNLAKRQALKALAQISSDNNNWPLELNSLLKRLVQTYQPGLAVQSLFGDQWLDFLTQALATNKQASFKEKMQLFQQALYQAKPATQLDFAEYQSLIKNWIKDAKLVGRQSTQRLSKWNQQHIAQGGTHV
ncbi:DUF4381 domain-containing protein [Paraglaciecola sp.]|uniref:DUF4381 domain-containing protein n=1 Tax=Paraglaciecola sp. TaxID=1920173 RepID=UPI0030F49C1A